MVSNNLVERVRYLKSAARMRADEQNRRRLEALGKNTGPRTRVRFMVDDTLEEDLAGALGMHDLRRTWATDSYYSLAFSGVPIAEQLVMSWGAWAQTSTGRETFRQTTSGRSPTTPRPRRSTTSRWRNDSTLHNCRKAL
ncbi:hypothetical protein [Halorarum halophilum]|uniref:hypothetical protein n=1 Tax=Halorarum halophilum TaxID=2743090 RepID=UPI001FEC5F43|nr:hypothetical protein [Halobaculum halophilum]